MIEIIYGHTMQGDNTLSQKKLSIGRGLPNYGQIDFITLVREDICMDDGALLWAHIIWHFWRKSYKNLKEGEGK